jgi:L,D-transpeptidase ErfK/SrfK
MLERRRARTRAAGVLGLVSMLCVALPSLALGRSYRVTGDLVGELALTTTVRGDTIADIARTYGQGYREMRIANPTVDPWLTGEDTEVIIPSLYLLPDAPREGIVVNVPEMRLYYFPRPRSGEQPFVATYPISIGRQDWSTPHGVTHVTSKVKDPSWAPPESIRREHAAEGDILPKVVGPGPDNPLGAYALRLGLKGYLIHGTDKPYGIGMRVTHGCMRLYPQDIETVYHTVPVGTPVRLVNQPYKLGIANDELYLEVHPFLDEDTEKFRDQFTYVVGLITSRYANYDVRLDWKALRAAVYEPNGIPRRIGRALAKELPRSSASQRGPGQPIASR